MTNVSHPILSLIQKFKRPGFQLLPGLIKKRVQQTNETFQLYNDTIDQHQDKGTNGDWRSIKWLSLGFTVNKKLKEKAHPHALYDINQETNTHASSTLIQHSIQNVKQDR